MSHSAAFIIPGHHEPLGAWSEARLWSALEDFSWDMENGFLPEATAREIIGHVGEELARRTRGEEAATSADPRGRALESLFEKDTAKLPAVRGVPALKEGRESRVGPERGVAVDRGAELSQERDLGLDP